MVRGWGFKEAKFALGGGVSNPGGIAAEGV